MIVKIPQIVKEIINEMPYNKTVKNNSFKIYAALYIMSERKNKFGFFPAPSQYLQSINNRYFNIMNYFEEKKLIQPYTRPFQDPKDIFKIIDKKYYDVDKGICMKYKFLINTEIGDDVDVDMITNRKFRWYEITQNSLLEYGYEVNIKRDTYGRRLWHSAIKDYKQDFKGYYTIDSICSQPRLLYNYMKQKGITDEKYNFIFENDLDFYSEVAHELNLEGRQEAKDLFMFWLNGNGYVTNFKIHNLFPIVSSYLKKLKKGTYKDSGSLLQRIESKIWIDDLLNNIPCNWALPIHDSFIVKKEDVDMVLEYCERKYPQIKFKKILIK